MTRKSVVAGWSDPCASCSQATASPLLYVCTASPTVLLLDGFHRDEGWMLWQVKIAM